MSDKMREEFEAAWAEAMRGDDPAPGRKPLRSLVDPDRYRGDAVNFAWRWWQRSRESLVIELPAAWAHYSIMGDANNPDMVLDEPAVIKAIEAAGLKVKP